jgi:deoxyribodipyrimidine photo-lyase
VPTQLIQDERVRVLRDVPPRPDGDFVLYWMQQSQRAEANPALEHAVRWANQLDLGLVVAFGLMDGYPEANLRHYRFMLEGLAETADSLARRGIPLVVRHGHPAEVALEVGHRAALVVCDRGYLRHQKEWRGGVAVEAGCRVEEVEGDVVVPVETVSGKREWAARTLRPRIHRHLDRFLVELRPTPLGKDSLGLAGGSAGPGGGGRDGTLEGLDLSDLDGVLDRLDLDRSVPPVTDFFRGGTSEAKRRHRGFVEERLSRYDRNRNQPHHDDTSGLSPYLHFGQVSPVWVAMEVIGSGQGSAEDRDGFVEELVVRRELAANFVNFEPEYDAYSSLPDWARKTLAEHRDDEREHVYGRDELEAAATHDPYWNAAQLEMVHTGYMHNHMRMYWGKQILAWSPSPEEAFRTALHLNNKYFLDGRDPSSYTGVGWLFGLHDRAWNERDVFGKVRIMTRSGLVRKTDPDAYVEKVEGLVLQATG